MARAKGSTKPSRSKIVTNNVESSSSTFKQHKVFVIVSVVIVVAAGGLFGLKQYNHSQSASANAYWTQLAKVNQPSSVGTFLIQLFACQTYDTSGKYGPVWWVHNRMQNATSYTGYGTINIMRGSQLMHTTGQMTIAQYQPVTGPTLPASDILHDYISYRLSTSPTGPAQTGTYNPANLVRCRG